MPRRPHYPSSSHRRTMGQITALRILNVQLLNQRLIGLSIFSAYLSRGDSNLIVVDWGPLATRPCYFSAIFNLVQVGACTARLLLGLATRFSLNLATVHAVGFSLGGHAAAMASNGVQAATGSRLGRITGTASKETQFVLCFFFYGPRPQFTLWIFDVTIWYQSLDRPHSFLISATEGNEPPVSIG
jgi:hypothetical protein